MADDMSVEEAERLLGESFGGIAPVPDEKHNVHTFLHSVATSDDTTKTGYLSEEEVGIAKLPVRTYKELSLFCKEIGNMDYMSDYFNKKAEILTATSLSKGGFLTQLAVMMRRESTNLLKAPMKENKGWFKKKSNINNMQGGV
ncbi:hypothetical protein LCGC14_0571220 [marine sediment metagenome]|uniref:Uncharacterized protein n=1 Tax=marine sediment metagenome TaxID=412755 RepID=A0A0F9RP88_9ZZZZ